MPNTYLKTNTPSECSLKTTHYSYLAPNPQGSLELLKPNITMHPTLLSIQLVATSILLPFVAATGSDDCCNINLSSPACFSDPAGQLPDGQIRFNGSYPSSTFCLRKDGGLTDQNGFGCIVTGK